MPPFHKWGDYLIQYQMDMENEQSGKNMNILMAGMQGNTHHMTADVEKSVDGTQHMCPIYG